MRKEILKQAISQFGAENQLEMVIEECAELIQVINKCKRKKMIKDNMIIPNDTNHETMFKLTSEIADVTIMMEQIKMMLSPTYLEAIEISIDRKITRLEEKINSQNK